MPACLLLNLSPHDRSEPEEPVAAGLATIRTDLDKSQQRLDGPVTHRSTDKKRPTSRTLQFHNTVPESEFGRESA